MGDGRTYDHVCALRAVTSTDGMTADFYPFEPVFLGRVAMRIINEVRGGTAGRTYELAGPGVYTMCELVEITLRLIGRRRLLMPIPFAVAAVQARLFELLPSPPLTTSQIDLLRTDNVVSGVLPGFRELGIEPKGVEEVVATYIGRPHMESR